MPLILGIETSCDETAAAIVEDGTLVHSNVVWSQHELHERYRGVVPEIASRAHLERILPVIHEALTKAACALADLSAIAVGNRPGLIGSLIVGVSAAKALAWSLQLPLLGVDHVQAHLHAASLIDDRSWMMDDVRKAFHPSSLIPHPSPTFPALGLVVSGGHTSLYRLDSPTQLTLLGRTIDDAIGEAYDKAAVILNVPYPGGPNLDKLASSPGADPTRFNLPRSMLGAASLDFSFSGLKTALLYAVRGHPVKRGAPAPGSGANFPRSIDDLGEPDRRDLAAAFQHAAIDTLFLKIERAIETGSDPIFRSVIIGGGVSANSLLRQRAVAFSDKNGIPVHIPAMAYCLDNAAMIAGLAHHHLAAGAIDDLNLAAIATTGS